MRRGAVLAGAVAVTLSSGIGVAAALPPSPILAFTVARSVRLATRSGFSLSQAPASQRAAVHRTLVAAAAGGEWSQQAKLTGTGAAPGVGFGNSVAISGKTAVVGTAGQNGGGAAYVFVRSGKAWSQQAELTPPEAAVGSEFGYAVAISGKTVVVGAPFENSGGVTYVFARSGKAWSQQAELPDPGPVGAFDSFGYAVAISGKTAVVGAPGKDSGMGMAYVFVRSGKTWSQQAEVSDPAPTVAGDHFGDEVAISGKTAVIGADGKGNDTGAAYVFARSGKAWSQQAELTASDLVEFDGFGDAVAISGKTALVGAPGKTTVGGAAYVFVRSGKAWSQQAELTVPHATFAMGFGVAVAISGKTAVIGATNEMVGGATYVLVRSGTTWSQQAKLTDPRPRADLDGFGSAVGISGKTAVVSAPGKNSGPGAAYVFVR